MSCYFVNVYTDEEACTAVETGRCAGGGVRKRGKVLVVDDCACN